MFSCPHVLPQNLLFVLAARQITSIHLKSMCFFLSSICDVFLVPEDLSITRIAGLPWDQWGTALAMPLVTQLREGIHPLLFPTDLTVNPIASALDDKKSIKLLSPVSIVIKLVRDDVRLHIEIMCWVSSTSLIFNTNVRSLLLHSRLLTAAAATQTPRQAVGMSSLAADTCARLPIVVASINWNRHCATTRSGSAARIHSSNAHSACIELNRKCTLAGTWSECIRIMRPCWKLPPLLWSLPRQPPPLALSAKKRTLPIILGPTKTRRPANSHSYDLCPSPFYITNA